MTQLLPFILFAFVSSITPGPTNVLVLNNSIRHGFGATLPIIAGACAGAAGLVLLIGVGIGGWLIDHPNVQIVMSWGGAIWLSWLAWKIATKPNVIQLSSARRSIGPLSAASIQVINPKTWAMVLAVVGVFAGEGAGVSRYLVLAGVFLAVSLGCLAVWAACGASAQRLFDNPRRARVLGWVLGLALFGSAWSGLLGAYL